ncbi:MAG: hypothetical protein DRJ98_07195 [Thermoprotei archaeon]|nr:MAG: hypothetical protein DRJ98_07195 [Thermoprotei archaeon]RLF16942.1 MAG: hypothetical protein DRN06_04585 [Thermoprotei archaeon]
MVIRYSYVIVEDYTCPICGRECRTKSAIVQHLARVHGLIALDRVDYTILKYLREIYPEYVTFHDILTRVLKECGELRRLGSKRRSGKIKAKLYRLRRLGLVEYKRYALGQLWRIRF